MARKKKRRKQHAQRRHRRHASVPVVVDPGTGAVAQAAATGAETFLRRRPGIIEPSPAEAALARPDRLANQHAWSSDDELMAFLRDVTATGHVPEAPATTPLERAQDLAYRAWEAQPPARLELAREALAASPDCADALIMLALAADTPDEARRLLQEAVAAGERALGLPGRADELAGHFWNDQATRPYLRARLALARHLEAQGDLEAASQHYGDLIRLNPDDHQGVRYLLAPLLIRLGRDDQAGELLDRFHGDTGADWRYHRALLAWREGGDSHEARNLLDEALDANPFVPAYLLGRRTMPDRLPEVIGVADEDEAVHYAAVAGEAWRGTPGALAWLGDHVLRVVSSDGTSGGEGVGEEGATGPAAPGRALLGTIWQQSRAGTPVEDEEHHLLARAMEDHPEFHVLWDRMDLLSDASVVIGGTNPFLHVSIHAAAERQIAGGQPPEAAELVAALQQAGSGRHEAVHVLMELIVQQMRHVLRYREPYDESWYRTRLRYLIRLAREMAAGAAPPSRPKAGAPCPCGSGRRARYCCAADRWPPLPVIEAARHPGAPDEARRRRPGLLMVLGAGRFAPGEVLARLPQDDQLLSLENAVHVAEALERLGDTEGAWQAYRRILAAAEAMPPGRHDHPVKSALQEILRHCQAVPGHERDGIEAAERLAALAEDPEDAALWRLDAAELHLRLGDGERAETIYREQRAAVPLSPWIPFRWAMILDEAGRNGEAAAALETVLQLPAGGTPAVAQLREEARRILRELRRGSGSLPTVGAPHPRDLPRR